MPIGVIRLARAARASGTNALDHIRVTPGQNGGFNVQHFGNDGAGPQNYNFGSNEGQGMLDHIASTFKIGSKSRPPASPPRPGKTRGGMKSSSSQRAQAD